MKKFILAALLLVPSLSSADSIILGAKRWHVDKYYATGLNGSVPKEFNEVNAMFAYEKDNRFYGVMKNSYHEEVAFLGRHFKKDWFGLMLICSTGYEESSLPRAGKVAFGGYLTAEFGPFILMTIPTQVAAIAYRVSLD